MASPVRESGSSRRIEPPAAPSDRTRRLAILACVAAAILFAIVCAVSYGQSYVAEPLDRWWNELMVDQRTEAGLVLAWIPAVIGGPISMLIIGLLLVATLLYLRWKLVALIVAAAMVASVALAAPLAAVVARTRPEGSLAESVPTSFPSGHTAMAATVAVILGLVLRHWIVWLLGAIWVIVMAWSRTYLEAHWLTDVIAGALLGVIAGTVVWYGIETIRSRRATSRPAS